jgi:isopenicillin-N N-acyltransferase-like protein
MGYEHGSKAREKIQRNLQIYFRRFKNETELSREQVLERAEKYLRVIRRVNPSYARTMEGVALGSGSRLLEIVALNVRYELMYSQFAKIGLKPLPRTYGCTAFAAEPRAVKNKHLLMAQNWDWIPQVEGLFLKIRADAGPNILCFTEAGVVGGKIGLNSAGLGLLINGLVSDHDDWARLEKPFHVRCWEILRSKTLKGAVSIISRGGRSCSANFLLGQQTKLGAGKVVDIESAPGATRAYDSKGGIIAHTNHFLDPASLGVKQIVDEERRSTLQRYRRITELLEKYTRDGETLDLTTSRAMLRDHDGRPESVCRHPNPIFPEDERYGTVVSVVMDLYSKRLEATTGSPCENEYQTLML